MKTCTMCGVKKNRQLLNIFMPIEDHPMESEAFARFAGQKITLRIEKIGPKKKRNFYHKNIDRIRGDQRLSYAKHAEKRREEARKNHYENRDELNKRRRPKANKRFHDKYKKDPAFTLTHRVRALIHRSLKHGVKSDTLNNILDYSMMDLRRHLESKFTDDMSWDEFMNGNIHIDHIIPISHFKPKSVNSVEFKECWSLSNLQPLWASDNLSKGGKTPC